MNWETWLYSLFAGCIGGASSAGLSILVMPDVFSFSGTGLQHFYKALFIGALIPVLTFLKQSPLPNGSFVSKLTTTTETVRTATPHVDTDSETK
jgi:hypothetical protein